MIHIRNQQRKIKVNLPKIERTIKKILRALAFPHDPELSLLLVNDKKIKELNLKFRGINEVTDVLSFPAKSYPLLRGKRGGIEVIGDIVISLPAALRHARERGRSLYEEINTLLIHSILHLQGYSHESDSAARRMRRKERRIGFRIYS